MRQLLLVQVGGDTYGLASEYVREVTTLPAQVTRLPGAGAAFRGLANVRGQLFPVLDLAQRVGGTSRGDAQDVVVVACDGRTLGVLVDEVRDVTEVEGPAEAATTDDGLVCRVGHSGETVVIELDVPRLVGESLA